MASILLTRTRFGRNVFATGGNQEAARLAGINVPQVQAITFILLGAAAALAGIVNSSRSISAQPSDDFSFVFAVLTAVIVGGTSIMGGKGAIWRTVAAAFFLAFMNNGFNLFLQVDPLWQKNNFRISNCNCCCSRLLVTEKKCLIFLNVCVNISYDKNRS